MAYWIFKIANQSLYDDAHGERYVYDNTHSVRVRSGDVFLYLDKRFGYGFSGTGTVGKVSARKLSGREPRRNEKVNTIFTAHLRDMIWFTEIFTLSRTRTGMANRARLGIVDVNLIGWSPSMPALSEALYNAIMELVEADGLITQHPNYKVDYFVDDEWSKTRVRTATAHFCRLTMERHNYTCIVCGSTLRPVLEAAHLSPYAVDKENRANPANGICLCTFCHRLLDRRLIGIRPNGQLLISEGIRDAVALEHLSRVSDSERKVWLSGVDPNFLNLSVKLFEDYASRIAASSKRS
jgi:hypothetical protein